MTAPEFPAIGPEWTLGPDGVYFRHAARVILLDRSGRVLLARGHDLGQPGRSWWFTIGGGIEQGESESQAAVRELREETGIVLTPGDLIGPIFTRIAHFDFVGPSCRQHETYFLAQMAGRQGPLTRDGWTELEHAVVDEMAWWPLDQLRLVTREVFPVGLADLIAPLLSGWDGVTRHLGEAFE